MKKQITILLFCVLLLAICSCAENPGMTDISNTGDADITVIADNTTQLSYESLLSENDYKGYEFRFMTTPDLTYADTMDYTEQIGEPVQDAVWMRNRITEDWLNITVSSFTVSDVSANVKKSITAGDTSFDCCTLYFSDVCTQFIASDYFMNLNNIPTLDFSRSWWDQNMHNSLTINGNIITMVGDILPPSRYRMCYF